MSSNEILKKIHQLVTFVQWFINSCISQGKYFLFLPFQEKWENSKYLVFMLFILLGFEKKRAILGNTFYNLYDLPCFGKYLKKAIFFDGKLARSILDPKHKGVRAWEYGMALTHIHSKPEIKILDVGSGNSAFPFYLAHQGAQVTCIDLPNPEQKANRKLLARYPQVRYDYGSMLSLPYADCTFDVVLCISTIEHLQFHIAQKKRISYHLFLRKTQQALAEMSRVLRPGGRMFITSDAYIPNLQMTDRYSESHSYKGIGAAFKTGDLERVFLDTLSKYKCRPVGKVAWSFDALINDSNRSIYRGRYFMTFSIFVEKV